jgi:hypothetical protein
MVTPIDAKLTIDLDRFVLGSGYYLQTKVVIGDPAKTNPPELEKSVLVRLATITQPEVIARICSRTDLAAYPEPTPPMTLHRVQLSSPSIQAALASPTPPLPGDLVTVQFPDIWEHIYPGSSPFVTTVAGVGFTDFVAVSNEFPTYFSGLTYTITRGPLLIVGGVDGKASRYNPNGDMYCRVTEDYTAFQDLVQAINKLEAVRAEAQGLVDDYDRSGAEFEGYSEEFFT